MKRPNLSCLQLDWSFWQSTW